MRQNGCRDAKLTVLPTFSVNARGGQQQFARVDKILVVRVAFKTMPARVGFEAEEAALPGDRLGRVILPWTPRHHWRNKGLDHLAVGDDRFARLNAQRHTLGPQAAAALTFMNFGVDVQRGKQRIERAGGGMQHKGVIQPLVRTETRLAAQMVILLWICDVCEKPACCLCTDWVTKIPGSSGVSSSSSGEQSAIIGINCS